MAGEFDMRRVGEIMELPPHLQIASQVSITGCHFGEGHDWQDVTIIGSPTLKYECARCGARGEAQTETDCSAPLSRSS